MLVTLVIGSVGLVFLVLGTYFFLRNRFHRDTYITWGVALICVGYLRPAVLLLPVGAIVGATLHEGLHYVTGRIWMPAEDVHWHFKDWYVMHDSLDKVPTSGVRLIGGIPYLAMTILFIMYLSLYETPFSIRFGTIDALLEFAIIGIITGLGVGVSSSDLLAVLYPSVIQEWESEDSEGARERLKEEFTSR